MISPRVFIQTMITLASASLGLIAALAWNEAMKAAIEAIFGTASSLAGLFAYAVVATILAIVVLVLLARVASRLGEVEAVIVREVEG